MLLLRDPAGHVVLLSGAKVFPVLEPADLSALIAAGLNVANVSEAQLKVITG
jgi:hypothetical protein